MRRCKTALWAILSCDCVLLSGCAQRDDSLATSTATLNADPALGDFVLYAANSMSLGESSHVSGGDVGVVRVGHGPSLVPGYELAVLERAHVSGRQNLVADSLLLRRQARVGDVQVNELSDRGARHGGVTPFLPLPALPAPAAVAVGHADRRIRDHATATLQSGRFATVTIGDHAVVRLAGGSYQMAAFRVGRNSRVEALAAADVRIAGRLSVDDSSYIGPKPGTGLSARDFRIEVSGENGRRGGLSDRPYAVSLGDHDRVRALLLAANGRLELGEHAHAEGAFFARDLDVGERSHVVFEDGFAGAGCPGSCDDDNPCTTDACTGGTCTHAPASAGTSCADANACNGAETCDGAGNCQAGTPVVCTALDDCHDLGICNPATGACSEPSKPDGTACDDGDPCMTGDTCQMGECESSTQEPDGTACNDFSACTPVDLCMAGECVGGNPVACAPQDECHATGSCDEDTGECSNPVIPGAICTPLPPDPTLVAPPLDPSVATNLFDATAFLYTGDNPIQNEVAAGTIDLTRVAVLRGRVQTREGAALPGVTISVHDHPEFGTTRSRADGAFDLVVNGGGFLTVQYRKNGYLPAQRKVQTPWLDFANVPDAALVPLDPNVSRIELPSPDLQVARGSLMVDDSGLRRTTLLFLPGTEASMTLADCSTEALGLLSVRATEYTVGPNGPAAMPAELPPTSFYTYAAELRVDQAVAAGATRVEFSEPVVGYLENFLDFPTGTVVPAGYYDSIRTQWTPSQSGRVVEIVGELDGLAQLDTDGDGEPDDGETDDVEALSITHAELEFLGANHPVGTRLWRTVVGHFTAWDNNWAWDFAPGDDAVFPGQELPLGDHPIDNPNSECGTVIEVQNQTLGYSLGVPGAPVSLEYRSDRVPGRFFTQMNIPLSGTGVPDSLRSIHLSVSTAGQALAVQLPPLPNQTFPYEWNGRDAYGRPVQGRPPTQISIGYVYDAVYQQTSRFGYNGGGLIGADRARRQVTLWQRYSVEGADALSAWDAHGQGLGGWTLDVHHVYDPQAKMLHLGTGERRSVETLQSALKTVAGRGEPGFSGDGGPAREARLCLSPDGCEGGGPQVAGVAVGPDGSVYIADVGNCRLRRVDRQGIIDTVAGTGFCDGGDPTPEPAPESCGGGPAPEDPSALDVDLTPIEAAVGPDGSVYIVSSPVTGSGYGNGSLNVSTLASKIYRLDASGKLRKVAGNGSGGSLDEEIAAVDAHLRARDVAVAPDGALYIADSGHHRIRRVGPDGIITTIAGNGTPGFEGDGGPAVEARFNAPTGVAIGPDGTVYVADRGNQRIRSIEPDGMIQTTAGGGVAHEDGVPALSARLDAPIDVAVGSLYLADPQASVVRRVRADGLIETIAGGGPLSGAEAEGQPPKRVALIPTDVETAADGTTYLEDLSSNKIWRVAPPLPGVSVTESAIAAADASEVYVFDRVGRHLRTISPLTGATLLEFSYDGLGRVSEMVDGDGNETRIERDAQGRPTAVVGPYGQTTRLELNPAGNLALVENSLGESSEMAYDAGGLLVELKNPRGGLHEFAYDPNGRLVRDTDPAEGFRTLERVQTPNGQQVTLQTALGRVQSYDLSRPPAASEQERTSTLSDGTQAFQTVRNDASFSLRLPDDSEHDLQLAPDARFGLQAPVATARIASLPSGLTSFLDSTRTVNLADPANPLSLISQTETRRANGRLSSRTYDAATRTFLETSAMGRQTTTSIDGQGKPEHVQVAGLAAATFSYDSRGRLASVASADLERVARFDYDEDGRLASIADPLDQTTSFVRDGAGRVLQQILPDSSVVSFGYDAHGNVTSVTPPQRQAHALNYTPLNVLSAYTPPQIDAGDAATLMAYDLDNQLTLVTRPDGTTQERTYDFAGRVASLSYSSPGSGGRESISWSYDAAGRVAAMASDSGITLGYAYDGPLVTLQSWAGAISGSVEHGYDQDFRISAEQVSGTDAVTFDYDGDGLMIRAGELSLTYSTQNALLMRTEIAGVGDERSFNESGEVGNYAARFFSDELYGVSFTRDALGRVVEKVETIGGVTSAFAYRYDVRGRLVDVDKNGVLASRYSYDANGNRVGAELTSPEALAVSASYDGQDRLIAYGANTYAHSANGELVSKTSPSGTTTYRYDGLGNLRGAQLPGGTSIDYVVDARNRRVGKRVNGELVQGLLYGSALRPVAELDGDGQIKSRFVYATRVNVPDYMIREGRTFRILTDAVGSPRLVVDVASGETVQRIDYDEFGNVVADTNSGFQPFGFAGGLYDGQTGLVHFGAREYDPETGRWTRRDPLLFVGSHFNLYGYCIGDPINFSDPYGLVDWAEAGEALGGMILNGIGLVGSAALMVGTSVTGVGLVAGGAGVLTTTYGFGANAIKLAAAFQDKNADSTGSLIIDMAANIADAKCLKGRDRKLVMTAAAYLDFGVGLATGKVATNALSAPPLQQGLEIAGQVADTAQNIDETWDPFPR